MKKKRLLILFGIIVLIIALIACLVACNGGSQGEEEDIDDPVNPSTKTITPAQSLEKVYNGLIAGGERIKSASSYGVSTVYEMNTYPPSGAKGMLNYTLTYKANYNENYADSELYVRVFDNNAHIERLVVYYDGSDLYFISVDDRFVISDFSTTMMFNVFYEACRELDMTPFFFGEKMGSIFDSNSVMNLSMIVNANNTSYRYAGAGNEVVEYKGLDVTILNESVNNAMNNFFRGVGNKFDLISNRFLGFSVNRLAETRVTTIEGELIQTRLTNDVANRSVWEIKGRLQDTNFYQVKADVGYNDGTTGLSERSDFDKRNFTEATLGKNRFLGTVLLPTFSDVEYDAEIVTNISSSDNMASEMSVRIADAVGTDFLSAYYRGGKVYVNATGVDEWLDGAIDISALNLPKVYFSDIDLSKLINAGYNNVIKSMLKAVQRGTDGIALNEDAYDTIMENFGNDGKSYVYYIFTEEWYHKISGDDEPVMDKVARALGVERAQLASYLGEDFFLEAELELGYDLNSGVVSLKLREAGETVFIFTVERETYRGVSFPTDVYDGTSTYAKLLIPDVITMSFESTFNVRNGQTSTDMSRILGALIGDSSGINSKNELKNTEVLIAKGSVSESYYVNSEGETVTDNVVDISLYIRKNNSTERKLIAAVRTNPNDRTELLVAYYLAMGVDLSAEENAGGLFYRIKKDVVAESFSAILGEDNLFSEANVLTILEKVLSTKGISQVSKIGGWFSFSLVVSDKQDPVKELIGLENTTATVKARVTFTGLDSEIDMSAYDKPIVTPLEPIVIGSVYEVASAWKDRVEVFINNTQFHCSPNYDADSVTVVTGKTRYNPTAKLFGEIITYEVDVADAEGTYRVSRLADPVIILDPTYTSKLPEKVEVIYDNGQRGYLNCEIEGFSESNITLAGYNLPGFADKFDECVQSTVVIGVQSIMHVTFDVYVLVHNRKIIPETENEQQLSDGNGVPVVATLFIDPYTYAMRLRDDPDYDPIVDGLNRTHAELRFENVYGQEEIPEGDTIVVRDLTYDAVGYNRFVLADAGLTWEYDPTRITWEGSSGYAYARFGSDDGEALDIAVRVTVGAQKVDHIVIDDEDNNVYTIDFLQRATYTVPTQSVSGHVVKIYFKGADSVNMKYRYVSLSRPMGLSDDEYHDTYLAATLNWDGFAQDVIANPYIVTASRNEQVRVSATFGSSLKVGEQTVALTVEIPDRTQDTSSADQRYVAVSCETDESGEPTFGKNNVSPSKAYFPETDGIAYTFYDYLRINPYDMAFRIPNSIYLEVPKVSGYRATTVVKQYDVTWVTTDTTGKELNLIEEKVGGGFGLKHPVTDETDMVIYGKVGDRGNEPNNSHNLGYVWIVMIIRNEKSELRSITYSGLEEDAESIGEVDPYGTYALPYSFRAVLESGRVIEQYDVEWEVRVGEEGSYVWYPATYTVGCGAPAEYYKNNKFVFDYHGGVTAIRYIIEGNSESIRQTLTLNVEVLKRTLASDRVDVYAENGAQPQQGYDHIDVYESESSVLHDRLVAIESGNNVAGVTFLETGTAGVYVPSYLNVDWLRALPGDASYEHSLDYLIRLTESADAIQDLLENSLDGSITLIGTIYTGTINEQTLSVRFSFEDRKIAEIVIGRLAYAQEKDAVRIDVITELSTDLKPYADDAERSSNRHVDFSLMGSPRVLNIRLDKPFALTYPDESDNEKYASPKDYFTYVLGEVEIAFSGSAAAKRVTPVLSFVGTDDAFNKSVLLPTGTFGVVSFTIDKLSAGSALDPIVVNVYTLADERLDDSDTITPELFDQTGAELYSESKPYPLPAYIDVAYRNSGLVRYDVPAWTVEGVGMSDLFGNDGETSVIEAKLFNTIRSESTVIEDEVVKSYAFDADAQANLYNFAYVLPCVDATYRITVYIPRKDIRETAYRAVGETSLYNIEDGVLTIDNPYLYYDPDVTYIDGKKYGFDVSKIPSRIIPNGNEFDFWQTEVSSYAVSWNFVENVFTSDLFAQGTNENLKIAEAILPAYYAYYDGRYVAQRQTVSLYLKVNALVYDGIAHEDMTVVENTTDGKENVIQIDPYNDLHGYAGRFNMPVDGLTVKFGAESYVFNDVEFYLRSKTGSQYPGAITVVEYDERGHLFSPDDYDLREDGILEFNMYLPGFGLTLREDGSYLREEAKSLRVYVNVLSKVIETAYVPNVVYDSLGSALYEVSTDSTGIQTRTTQKRYLPAIYYIDPYNAATYALPTVLQAKFVGYDETEEIVISGWELYDERTGKWSDFPTDTSSTFYSRATKDDSAVRYGFYNPGSTGYRGAVYRTVRGYISMGRSVTGEVTKQTFEVAVIVLNRSLKASYNTSYRYEEPFGGLLEDIGGEMSEDMFVSYEKYYEEYFVENNISDEYKYSEFGTPIIPTINWAVYNDNSVIEPLGGFDKDIEGNAYYGATHRDNAYADVANEQDKRFELLARALIWDSYFTDGGYPLAYYSATTTANLNNLATALKEQVVLRTYEILIDRLSASDDEAKKQYANYLSNGLVNEIVAENNYSRETQMVRIAVAMYALLKEEYESDPTTERANIYVLWKAVHDEFVSEGSETNATLSEMQAMKAAYYALANDNSSPTFTETEKTATNAALRAAVENKLNWYKKASVFDVLYDRSTAAERSVMDRFLLTAADSQQVFEGVAVEIIYKAVALDVYMRSAVAALGSIGESVYAHITAPAVTLGDVFDITLQDGSNPVLTEFLFNIYNEEPFLSEVGVGVTKNYADIYGKYLEEGIRLAIEEYRSDPSAREQGLTQYVADRIAYYVNGIVPMVEEPGTGGDESPLINFTYADYAANSGSNVGYWNELYQYYLDQYDAYMAVYLDPASVYSTMENPWEARWTAAYHAHELADDADILAEMDDILEEKLADTSLVAGEGQYQAAFNDYAALMQEVYLKEMNPHLASAIVEANALVADLIFDETSDPFNYLRTTYGSFGSAFSVMYGDFMDSAYQTLYKSLSGGLQGQLRDIYQSMSGNAGVTMHYVMRNGTLESTLISRAEYIFLWKLGASAAWDYLYENAESVGYTQAMLDDLMEAATNEDSGNGYLMASNYNVANNGAFTETQFADYCKTVLLKRVIERTANVTNKNKIESWLNAAIAKSKSNAVIRLYNDLITRNDETSATTLYANRDELGQVVNNAFNKYVAARVALGEAIGSAIERERTKENDRVIFDQAEDAVLALLSDSVAGSVLEDPYKVYLQPDQDAVKDYKVAAIEYYLTTYATAAEKVTINVENEKHATADLTYNALMNRIDVTQSLKMALRNAYATVLLADAFDKIKTSIATDINARIENGTAINDLTYASINERNGNLFMNVAAASNSLEGIRYLVNRVNAQEYVATVYTQKIAAYTAFVYEKKEAARDAVTSKVYDVFYPTDPDVFDALLDDYYAALAADPLTASQAVKNYKAFNYLVDLLVAEELKNYTDAQEAVAATYSKAFLYDDLGRYAKTSGDDASVLADRYRAAYEALTEAQIAEVDSIGGLSLVFGIEDPVELLSAFVDRYVYLTDADAGDARATIDALLATFDEISLAYINAPGGTASDAVLNASIVNSAAEYAYRQATFDVRFGTVRGAVAIATVLSRLSDYSDGIDRDFMTDENLSGDFTSVGVDYRASYIDGLLAILNDSSYAPTAEYLRSTIAAYRVDLATDDDLVEQANAAVIAKLLLGSDGPAVRRKFEEQLASYFAAVENAETYIARYMYYDVAGAYRMIADGADGSELFSAFRTAYEEDLTALDRSLVAGYFDASIFEASYSSNEAKYNAFSSAYNALLSASAGGSAAEAINRLLSLFSSAATAYRTTMSDTPAATALTDRIYADTEDISRASGLYDSRAANVRGAVGVAKTISRTIYMRDTALQIYMTEENRLGDFSETTEDYNNGYVAKLIDALNGFGYTGAAAVVNTALQGYIAGIDEDLELSAKRDLLIRAELTQTYSADLTTKMMTLFGAGETDLIALLNDGHAIIDLTTFVSGKRSMTELSVAGYREYAEGRRTDADYQNVFNAMLADGDEDILSFTTDVYASADDLDLGSAYYGGRVGRYGVIINAVGLTQSNDNTANGWFHILNGYKMDEYAYRREIRLMYGVITPTYVDYYDSAYVGVDGNGNYILKYKEGSTALVNTLVIDPLAPDLPTKVKAFGKYTLPSGAERLYDLGTPSVRYAELFYQNVYVGQEQNDTDYVVTLIDSRNTGYDLTISVTYLDARIDEIFVADLKNYGGNDSNSIDNYYSLYDETTGKNRMKIDPINEDIIDIENKAYVLPGEILVTYKNLVNTDGSQKQAVLHNVVWDASAVKYSLAGQTGVRLRPISYTVFIDETEYRVAFDYAGGTLTVSGNGKSITMQNAPDYNLFNVVLDVTDQTVTKLSIRGDDREMTTFGTYVQESNYIDVPAGQHTLNPFDVLYPSQLVLEFAGGDQKDYAITDWGLEYGANGTLKIGDIIQNNAQDFHAVAEFTYLGYTIRVRFVVDDIEIEGIEEDAFGNKNYIDGGTIYLVRGGGSAAQQLAANYSYLYYNFGTGSQSDFRKVALSFTDLSIQSVSTEAIRRYEKVLGVLGWDKVAYPFLGLSNNIAFTIEIIDPLMLAQLNGDYNEFVRIDYAGIPYDNNFQRANYSEEPRGTVPDAFVHYGNDGTLTFVIDKDATTYDVLGRTATYRCIFSLNGSNYRIAAGENGSRQKEFVVEMPLNTYLHTSVSDAVFDTTPVKDGFGNDIWTWVGDSSENAIRWKLGRSLKSSELPGLLYTYEGETYSINPLWDLTDLNVNRATDDGYNVSCYYYDKNGVWKELALVVYIDKEDVSEQLLNAIGGNVMLTQEYDAHYYRLPLDLNAVVMQVLREDGDYLALDESAVDIRYKKASDADREYSRTDYPIDVGSYDIRVIITDYNVELKQEMVFRLTITPIEIDVSNVEFENRVNNKIEYVYNGSPRPLTVVSGLPSVSVDNWFASMEEKQQLVQDQFALVPTYTTVQAKSRAYLELFSRVPRGAKTALSELSNKTRLTTGLKGDDLNAAVFDLLTPEFRIVEVITAVTYTQGDQTIGSVPTDVGTYTALFTLDSTENLGNYVLKAGAQRVAVAFEIVKPNLTYSLVSNELVYSGRMQNPRISGLHDENGDLPGGVNVTYSYTVSGEGVYFNNGIKDVGSYLCEVVIDGGNNYPSGHLINLPVSIAPKELYVRLQDAGSDYLDEVADLHDYLFFDGLVGGDKADAFGYTQVSTDVRSYFTIGEYEYVVDGFRIDSTYENLYSYAEQEVVIDGVLYNKIALKPVVEAGSLYTYVDTSGNKTFATLISKFTNYTVYIQKTGRYVISVSGGTGAVIRTVDADSTAELSENIVGIEDGERLEIRIASSVAVADPVDYAYRALSVSGTATVVIYRYDDETKASFTYVGSVRSVNGQKVKVYEVSTDEQLASAISGAQDGARVEIYLKSGIDGEGNPVEKTYAAVEMEVAGSVVIYGCYDASRNVVTYLSGIVVNDGALDLRIVGFRTNKNGAVCVDVGEDADDVRISSDCRFYSYHESAGSIVSDKNTVGVRTDNNYSGALTVNGCVFVGFRRAIESVGGSLRVEECSFTDNYSALTIESTETDVNVLSSSFAGNDVGIIVKNGNANIRFNTLVRNRFGVVVDDSIATVTDLSEDVLISRNNSESGDYVFDDTNVVKVTTGSLWAAAQQS